MAWIVLLCPLLSWPPAEERISLEVDGTKREALVVVNSKPAPAKGSPLIFAFHGHGGTARRAIRNFEIHELWPEAIVVYPQGIEGVKGITDAEGVKIGWQKSPGEFNDRDVKFFDALLKEVNA